MTLSVLEIKKSRRRKDLAASRVEALEQYEAHQREIKKLLKQIEAGLEQHDRAASGSGGHDWSHVGDLKNIEATLTDIRDRLHHTGEYRITY